MVTPPDTTAKMEPGLTRLRFQTRTLDAPKADDTDG